MTARPILFSAEMVRAILDGRKTQTRRVMKAQPYADSIVTVKHYHPTVIDRHGDMQPGPEIFGALWGNGEYGLPCPYGAPGDTLWVREGFAVQPLLWADNRGPQPIHYTADLVVGFAGEPDRRQIEDYRSKPSIHMPRWASRITLEVKSVRVERLKDISEDDARAEGCEARPFPGPWWQGYRDLGNGEMLHQQAIGETPPDWMIEPKKMPPTPWLDQSARDGFRSIWMGLHGPDAWDENPWVWVISFERVKP